MYSMLIMAMLSCQLQLLKKELQSVLSTWRLSKPPWKLKLSLGKCWHWHQDILATKWCQSAGAAACSHHSGTAVLEPQLYSLWVELCVSKPDPQNSWLNLIFYSTFLNWVWAYKIYSSLQVLLKKNEIFQAENSKLLSVPFFALGLLSHPSPVKLMTSTTSSSFRTTNYGATSLHESVHTVHICNKNQTFSLFAHVTIIFLCVSVQ